MFWQVPKQELPAWAMTGPGGINSVSDQCTKHQSMKI